MKKTTAAAAVVTTLALVGGGVGVALASDDHPWQPTSTPAATQQVPVAPTPAPLTPTWVEHPGDHDQHIGSVQPTPGVQDRDRDDVATHQGTTQHGATHQGATHHGATHQGATQSSENHHIATPSPQPHHDGMGHGGYDPDDR